MFLIAGVTPRVVTMEEAPQRCPSCGLYQARHRRLDHYFSLFFIPLLRVKKGEPFLFCPRCEKSGGVFDPPRSSNAPQHAVTSCGGCGRPLDPGFRFCPQCGRPV